MFGTGPHVRLRVLLGNVGALGKWTNEDCDNTPYPHPAHVVQVCFVTRRVFYNLQTKEKNKKPHQNIRLCSSDHQVVGGGGVCKTGVTLDVSLRWTHVGVSVSQEFVEDVAEFPAQHGIAGQWQSVDGRPERISALLMVSPEDTGWIEKVKDQTRNNGTFTTRMWPKKAAANSYKRNRVAPTRTVTTKSRLKVVSFFVVAENQFSINWKSILSIQSGNRTHCAVTVP